MRKAARAVLHELLKEIPGRRVSIVGDVWHAVNAHKELHLVVVRIVLIIVIRVVVVLVVLFAIVFIVVVLVIITVGVVVAGLGSRCVEVLEEDAVCFADLLKERSRVWVVGVLVWVRPERNLRVASQEYASERRMPLRTCLYFVFTVSRESPCHHR